MNGYIPFLFRLWQHRGLRWLEPFIDVIDARVLNRSRADECDWFFGSHGCDRRIGHRGDHRCGVHWGWPQGEGFQ